MNLTFNLPKTVRVSHVTIRDAGAAWTVSVCLDDVEEVTPTAEPDAAPPASVAVLAPEPDATDDSPAPSTPADDESAAARRRADAERARRYRARKRDASRTVTQNVTPSRDASRDGTDCLIDCNINNINLNNNNQSTNQTILQRSVTRTVTQRDASRQDQLWLPLIPELDNFPHLDTPPIRAAWSRWVRWRQTTKGTRYVSWRDYTNMLDTLDTAYQCGTEPAVLEVLDYAIRAERVNVLIIPESARPTAPTPDPGATARAAHARAEADAAARRELDDRLRAIGFVPDRNAWKRGAEAVEAEAARREAYLARLEG